jgi:hypothetical protein
MDAFGPRGADAGSDAVIAAAIHWLCQAQDRSASADGGVARDFSLTSGWSTSYPETTGYIVPTLLACAEALKASDLRRRAETMLDWLAQTQEPDGCWRDFATPFAVPGKKAYEPHVAWGLFEAERLAAGRGYAEAAMANVRWSLGWQHPNGWFRKCCLTGATRSLTHT